VLAIARSSSVRDVFESIVELRYKDRVVSFTRRNHFPSVDWIPSALKLRLLERVGSVHDTSLDVRIDKRAWFSNLVANPFYGHLMKAADESQRAELADAKVGVEETKLGFFPVASPFSFDSCFGDEFLMLALVRPNSPLSSQSGGGEVISHVGFAFKLREGWIFRAASERVGRVVDLPLRSVLTHRSKAPVVGVVVLRPVPVATQLASPAQAEA
ncbi:N-acetylmuramoyl-L-alanine amidase-like domain-containing protein, partial [Nostoc sp. NIES-2111]